MARHALLIASFLTFSGFILASPPGNARQIMYQLNLHAGSVLPHYETLAYFNREYVRAFELNAWFRQPQNVSPYNSMAGIGYLFSGLGNRDIYGHNHALFYNLLGRPVIKSLPLRFNIGFGLAWLTKKYDLETNYFNRAFGSHLNAYAQLGVRGRIPLKEDRLSLNTGLTFNHVSNGAVNAPNLGLNLFTLNAGLEFNTNQSFAVNDRAMKDTIPAGKHRFAFILAPGVKQVDRRVDKQIFTSSLIFDYGYRFHPSRSIGLGISLFYNDSWAYIPYIRPEKDHELSPFQSAIHLSWQMNRGPLAFILHPGWYMHHPVPNAPSMTNRLGVKYSFENNLCLQITVKSHWFATADYIEWGIGYEFNK